jgi:hypothetical protein
MVKTRKTRRPKRAHRSHKKTRRGGGFFDFFKQSKVAPEPNTIPPLSERPANIKQLSDNEAKRLSEIEDELDELTAAKDKDVNKIEQLKKEQRELTEKSLQPMQQKGSNQYASIFTKCKKSTFNQAFSSGDCNTLKKNYKPEFQLIDNNYNKLKQKIIGDIKKYVDKEQNHLPVVASQTIDRLVSVYGKIVTSIVEKYYIGTSETQQIVERMPYTKNKSFVYYPAKNYLTESDIQYFCFAVYDIMSINNGQSIKGLWYRTSNIANVPFGRNDSLIEYFGNKISCDQETTKCYEVLYSDYSAEKTHPQNPKQFIDEPADNEEKDTFYVEKTVPTRTSFISDLDESNPYKGTEYDTEPVLAQTPTIHPPTIQHPTAQPPTAQKPIKVEKEDLLKVINLASKTGKPRISAVYGEALAEEKRKCNEYGYNLRNYFNCSKVNRTSIAESDADLMRRLPKGGSRRRRRRTRRQKNKSMSMSKSRR